MSTLLLPKPRRIEAYLTIDDSPSMESWEVLDCLSMYGIKAVFFCLGRHLDINPAPMVEAVRRGHTLANHGYAHIRTSEEPLWRMQEDILRTENLIEDIYRRAGFSKPGRYFRFPHLDRGTAGQIIDPGIGPEDAVRRACEVLTDGINTRNPEISPALREKKDAMQIWLRENGYAPLPFKGVTLPWCHDTEIAQAADTLLTYSTADWMMLPRHKGRQKYKTLAALKKKALDDPDLWRTDTRHVILMHDKPDMIETFRDLIIFFQNQGMCFISI